MPDTYLDSGHGYEEEARAALASGVFIFCLSRSVSGIDL
jgi:hypothetical protein